ncbi:DUF6232 family protein [Actinoplanes missouriensis]|uniref:DUF6232 family protein n=1 Tax=Actinoplanes missouriensis TaxID=1866 RepID=UPI0033CF8F8D
MEMPVFYRGPRAYITHRVIEVPDCGRRRYPVDGLSDVRVVVDELVPDSPGSRLSGVSALVAALVQLRLVGPASVPLAVLLFVVLGACAAVCLGRRPRRRWKLRAGYQGRAVEIFESEDAREFAEVRRGLVRALEYHDS